MAFRFFGAHSSTNGSSSSSVKLFEVRLDNDYIVLRGSEDEAGSSQLTGSLALCLTEPLTISGITLTLSGILHMAYQAASNSAMSGRRTAFKEKTFFEKSWTFRDPGKGKTETLPSDNYEWPFNVVLDGTMPESVEGMKEDYIVYRLKAEITRKRSRDIVVRKPIRVVRTLGPSALELSHAMSVENVWPNKIEYSISTPSKAVIFGSFLQVDFKLIPLLKGLTIGNVATQLKEEQEFLVEPEPGVVPLNNGLSKSDRVIAFDNFRLDPDQELQILEEAAEGFQFSRYLELPKSLTKCMQDCNVMGIKIRHKIKFNVQLLNPDGHVSELRANLPVSLYISESLPLNEDNDLIDQTPQASRAAMVHDLANSAPPLYSEHQLDQLYSDVDPSGYLTPGAALSTSATPYSQSRNISSENLASLDAITSGSGHVSAAALQHRLQNLRSSERAIPGALSHDDQDQPRSGDLSRRNSHGNNAPDYFASLDPADSSSHSRISPHGLLNGHRSLPESAVISRRPSDEAQPHTSGNATPLFLTNHMEDLAKVPSYSTALKTPLPRNPSGNDLPSYGTCVSHSGPTTPVEPAHAHLRDSNRSESAPSFAPLGGIQTGFSHSMNRDVSHLQDNERRLRIMQLRGR